MSRRNAGELRIIGGAWRSRIVEFAVGEGVRPTPDRVRQTVFDWLAPRIEGARVLDLFAGSGALGLEALSRGAAHAVFVEQGRAQVAALRAALAKLEASDRAQVLEGDALRWLTRADRFDIVFLDPPYASDLLASVLPLLASALKPDARVYLEWPGATRPELPEGYAWLREKKAGQVSCGLLTHSSGAQA